MDKKSGGIYDGHHDPIKAMQHGADSKRTTDKLHVHPCVMNSARNVHEEVIGGMLIIDRFKIIQTEWPSPIVFFLNEDRLHRFLVHYQKPNTATIWDSDSILEMDEWLDSLSALMIC